MLMLFPVFIDIFNMSFKCTTIILYINCILYIILYIKEKKILNQYRKEISKIVKTVIIDQLLESILKLK